MDITVGGLIEKLSEFPKDTPLYFGATIQMTAYKRDDFDYEKPYEVEFDDWLEFKELSIKEQAYYDRNIKKTIFRDALVLEMATE
ncbi:MAG: hypothetical protein IKN54_04700 [Lachnospiraceae bacterium]|nr:hypothetical protein [Lachnospiraceae bacterium]